MKRYDFYRNWQLGKTKVVTIWFEGDSFSFENLDLLLMIFECDSWEIVE